MWHECKTIGLTISQLMIIIDDGLCFGFSFKVENGKLYWTQDDIEC